MKPKFDVVGHRRWWFTISGLAVILSLISMLWHGFNLGIDFTGGTMLDLKFDKAVTVSQVRDVLKDYQLEGSVIQLSGESEGEAAKGVFIRSHVLEESEQRNVLAGLGSKLGHFDLLRIEKVGATVGAELTMNAIWSLVLSWVLIIAYISYRFEFRFAISGILALVHNVIVVLGIFSILQREIDASFIAALLTVLGYSIHDTIVIFDRIRENLKSYRKGQSLAELVNKSIWQTMTRSIYTVLTVVFSVLALFLFGGDTTKDFSLALLVGFIVGAYSSIFNAAQFWEVWREYDARKLAMKRG